MRKKLIWIVSGAFVVTLSSLAIYATSPREEGGGELNASLSGTASLEQGPAEPVSSSYDLTSHQTLSRVILLIRENYVDPERVNPYDMFISALDHIQRTVPEVMVDDTQAPERVKVSVGDAEQSFDLGGMDQLWEVTMALRDIFRFLQAHLSDAEQRREVEYAAINGMLATLDPHSVLLKPESFDEVKLSTKGEFGGLGIVISIREGALTIISPIEGTPASRAGLKAKDRIVKIGEESTINMGLEEAVQRLRGRPGTKASIWVLRKGWTEARRYSLTRAIIKIESVSSELLADGIGYVRIKSFQNNTYDDLHDHLEHLRKKNKGELRGLVLDLRNNPGGLLDQAILVSDRFIDRGPLVITVGEGNRKREEKQAHFSGTERDYPIAVLTNGGSASASEIVSGALKNHDRAVIIGQQTFGKGSVQVLYDFKDKSALKLTIAQYLTPGDVSIQSVGIAPDVEIAPASISPEAVHLFVDDDSPREKDLEKHLDKAQEAKSPSQRTPFYRIVHLVPTPSLGEEDDSSSDKFEYDFETQLAHDLLAQAKSNGRKELLKEGRALFETRAGEQQRRIEERLRELGVDWTPGDAHDGGTAQAILNIDGKSKNGAFLAGDTISVKAVVRNTGSTPLYQVFGTTESENPLLKSLEFVFGKLEVGQTKSWKVDIKLPEDISSRADSVVLNLGDQTKTLHSSTSTIATIEEVAKPRFAYTLRVNDRARGNGDGLLQAGEKVDLDVEVTNIGSGEAKDALVSLKNLAGEAIYLDRGRDKLGALKAGASRDTSLRFSVREGAPKEGVQLRLSIWDSGLGSPVSETVTLPVGETQKGQSEPRLVRAAQSVEVPVYGGASTAASVIGELRPGSVLRSDLRFANAWRRVEVSPGLFGFVREAEVKVSRGSAKSASGKGGVRLLAGQAPPSIDLELPSLVTQADVLQLHGKVSDERALKDMFVFVNDKKVYYRSLSLTAHDGRVSAPIDLMLSLKEGSNTVAVVVRENDDVSARRIFGVLRGNSPAVAERTDNVAAPTRAQ